MHVYIHFHLFYSAPVDIPDGASSDKPKPAARPRPPTMVKPDSEGKTRTKPFF